MFKKGKERVIDVLIKEVEKQVYDDVGTKEGFDALMALQAIRHDENMRQIDQDLITWYKGFGSAFVIAGIGFIITKLLSR